MNISTAGKTLIIEMVDDLVANVVRNNLDKAKATIDNNSSFDSVTLDISNVDSIDSIGVTFVVGLYKTSVENNKKFKVMGASEDIVNLFSLMRLDEIFTVE